MATTLRYGPSTAREGHGPTDRLPGDALPEAPPGLGHLKAHSSLIVNRQAEDGGAVDAPGHLARVDGGAGGHHPSTPGARIPRESTTGRLN